MIKIKKWVAFVVFFGTLLGASLSALAGGTRGYLTYESVNKTGSSTVYSNSTGSNTYYAFYGGEWSSHGDLVVHAQVYYSGEYYDVKHVTLNSNNVSEDDSVYYAPFKLFRVKCAGTGRGMGWIQGQE